LAISCIQKNVRKFYQIRDWDWWKLYIKVKPVLNVHRTEEELRDREVSAQTINLCPIVSSFTYQLVMLQCNLVH